MNIIDLNMQYKSSEVLLSRKKHLNDIIVETQDNLNEKTQYSRNVTKDDMSKLNDLIRTFSTTYASLKVNLEKTPFFNDEPRNHYIDNVSDYALYSSAKAICNQINDSDVQKRFDINGLQTSYLLGDNDLKFESVESTLSNILERTKKVSQGNNIGDLKYNTFCFFNTIKTRCQTKLINDCSKETIDKLIDLEIVKEGLDFKERRLTKKKEEEEIVEKEVSPERNKNMPNELVNYIPKEKATLDKVVGDQTVVHSLRSAIIKTLAYCPENGKNPFNTNGHTFKTSYIVHGLPGVGKNFIVDSLINYFDKKLENSNKEVEFVDLTAKLKSTYQNESAMILEKYISLQNDPNKVYVNILNEIDGPLGLKKGSASCEAGQSMNEVLKKTVDYSKGNAIYISLTNYAEKLDPAFRDKSVVMELKGPSKPEHFAKCYENELGVYGDNLNESDFYKLGKITFEKKKELEEMKKHPLTFRFVEGVCSKFTGGKDDLVIRFEDNIINSNYDTNVENVKRLCVKPTYEQIEFHVKKMAGEYMKGNTGDTNKYN